eukprot:g11563.t1
MTFGDLLERVGEAEKAYNHYHSALKENDMKLRHDPVFLAALGRVALRTSNVYLKQAMEVVSSRFLGEARRCLVRCLLEVVASGNTFCDQQTSETTSDRLAEDDDGKWLPLVAGGLRDRDAHGESHAVETWDAVLEMLQSSLGKWSDELAAEENATSTAIKDKESRERTPLVYLQRRRRAKQLRGVACEALLHLSNTFYGGSTVVSQHGGTTVRLAAQCCEIAQQIAPCEPASLMQLSNVLRALGRRPEAIEKLWTAIVQELDGRDPDLLHRLVGEANEEADQRIPEVRREQLAMNWRSSSSSQICAKTAIVCVLWGTKQYGVHDVNKLFRAVKRNLRSKDLNEVAFTCFTDRCPSSTAARMNVEGRNSFPTDAEKDKEEGKEKKRKAAEEKTRQQLEREEKLFDDYIRLRPIGDGHHTGWWGKAALFCDAELGGYERVICLDLDQVIVGDISWLVDYGCSSSAVDSAGLLLLSTSSLHCELDDKRHPGFNSSVMAFEPKKLFPGGNDSTSTTSFSRGKSAKSILALQAPEVFEAVTKYCHRFDFWLEMWFHQDARGRLTSSSERWRNHDLARPGGFIPVVADTVQNYYEKVHNIQKSSTICAEAVHLVIDWHHYVKVFDSVLGMVAPEPPKDVSIITFPRSPKPKDVMEKYAWVKKHWCGQ